MRRLLIGFVLVTAVAGLAACWYAGSILIAPRPGSIGASPADLPVERVSWRVAGKGALDRQVKGWFIPGAPGKGAVILLHSLRADRRSMLGRARFLNRAGYAALMFDFQAHGETPGRFMTFGLLESDDVDGAVRYLRSRLPGEKIGVLGSSLGGAAVLFGDAARTVDALVLEAVYTTLPEAVENRLMLRFGSPGRYLAPLLLWQVRPRLGLNVDDLSPIDHIDAIAAPLLVIAGSQDRRTTLAQSQRLFERAPAPKSLWVIDGARHQDLHLYAGRAYERRVLRFFQRHLPSSP